MLTDNTTLFIKICQAQKIQIIAVGTIDYFFYVC